MILVATEYCPFCMRCILALEEKGIKYELSLVNLAKKAEFPELLSPYERVPVLKHDGKSIWESSVICEYLEDICPNPSLLPTDPWKRANARFWIDFCNTRFMPTYFNLLKSSKGSKREILRNDLLDHLGFMNTAGLSKWDHSSPYWMGKQVSLADFAFYPFFERFADVEEYRGIEISSELKNLQNWIETMRNHPAIGLVSRPRSHYVEYFRNYYAD